MQPNKTNLNPLKLPVFLSLYLMLIMPLHSQTKRLDLFECIELAADSSLRAFQAKSAYLSGYWDYRTYKARHLPSVQLNLSPLQYNHSITQRYDYNENIDIYRSQQSLSSSAGVSVSQLLGATGGTFTANSSLNYLQNMGENNFTQFSTTPFRIGYSQTLFGFNSHKWDKKLEPVKYGQTKMQFLYEKEGIAGEVVQLFFALASVQTEYGIARENLLSTDTLYRVGLERQKISVISPADMMTLELDRVDAENTLKNLELELKNARFALASYLNMEGDEAVEPEIPLTHPVFIVDKETALTHARENNPDYIQNQRDLMESRKNVESSEKGNSVTASISGGVGFNQAASSFKDAYINPSQQDYLTFGLSIPAFDWGIRKGRLSITRNNLKITRLSVEQKEEKLKQEIVSTIDNFNLQCRLIESARRALELSKGAYDNTKQRFIVGKAEVANVTIASNRYKSVRQNYVNILRQYWTAYYKIRRLTLYDFANNQDLSSLFEENIKEYYYE